MTDFVGIRPEHLRIVQDVLRDHLPAGVEVRVFGSRAQWSARDASDLDLVLEGETEIDRKVIEALADAFENSELPYAVDVVDINRVNERFRQIIKDQWVHLTPGGQWIDCTLADACDAIDYGLTASASDKPDGPRFLRITDIVSGPINWDSVPYVAAGEATTTKYRLNDGDIVIARTGASTGSSAYIKNPPTAVFASYLVRLVAKPEFDSRFLAYYLQSPNFKAYINGVLGDKSAQPNASASTMTKAPLYAPRSKDEQRAIANVLGALDDKIELNRRMNETLEQMARALYKSWFVDFGPVHAKMDEHWRKGESLLGLPAELYELFPDSLVPSELGETPEGWEVKTLGELCDKPQYGYTTSAQSEQVGPKFLRITDINKRPWIEWANVPHCVASEQDCEKFRVRKGDVLITRMADPGHGVMVEEDLDAVFASYLIRFRPRNAAHGRLLQYWLKSSGYWEVVHGRGAGTTRTSLNARVLSGFPLLVPSDPVAKRFSDAVHAMRNRVVANTAETETLTTQRDALLPRLVSGMLRVAETNIMEPV